MRLDFASRSLWLLTLATAPWLIGGVGPWTQWGLATTLTVALVLLCVDRIVRSHVAAAFDVADRRPGWRMTWPLLLAAGPVVVGVLQILPIGSPLRSTLSTTTLAGWIDSDRMAAAPVVSLVPSATRAELARLWIAVAAVIGGSVLFADRRSRRLLWTVAAAGGVLMALFAIGQKLVGNGRLYGVIPLTEGGQPFGPYVNRNNAAGLLNLAVVAAIGLLLDRDVTDSAPEEDHRAVRPIGSLVLPRAIPSGPATTARQFVRRGRRGQSGETFAQPRPAQAAALWSRRTGWAVLALGALVSGVLLSGSRGGTLSLLVTLPTIAIGVACSPRTTGPGRLLAIGGMAALAGLVALIAAIAPAETFSVDRLGDLRSLDRVTDGRTTHWRETLDALRETPWLGTGLGTYQDANRPFQNRSAPMWFRNADGEPVEWLLETGLIGTLSVAVFLVSLGGVAIRRIRQRPNRAAGVVLVSLLLVQTLQAATDFGITLPANALLAATLIGSAIGAPGRDGRIRGISLAALAACTAMCIPAIWTLQKEATAVGLTIRPTTIDEPSERAFRAVVRRLDRINSVQGELSDRGRLHRQAARLQLQNLRSTVFRALAAAEPEADDRRRRELWEVTAPNALEQYRRSLPGPPSLDELVRDSAEATAALAELRRALDRAAAANPLLTQVAILEALVDDLPREQRCRLLRHEAALVPTDPERLHEVAVVATLLDEPSIASVCWRRALAIEPQRAAAVLEALPNSWPTDARLSILPPGQPQIAVLLATRDADLRKRAIAIAEAEPLDLPTQADIARLRGRDAAEIRLRRQAVDASPLQMERHLALIETLTRLGRLDEAEAAIDAAGPIDRQSSRLRSLRQQVAKRRDRSKKR